MTEGELMWMVLLLGVLPILVQCAFLISVCIHDWTKPKGE